MKRDFSRKLQHELKKFPSMLKQEIKTHSTAVQKRSPVSNVKAVGKAVKLVVEKEEYCINVMIYGVSEDCNQTLESQVEGVLHHVGQKSRIVECYRLRREQDGSVRPVKVTFLSSGIVKEVLQNSNMLKSAEGYRKICICRAKKDSQRPGYSITRIEIQSGPT